MKKDKEESTETKYLKEQIIKSNKYKNRVDILNVLLKNNEQYTLSEVDKIIKKFMERKV